MSVEPAFVYLHIDPFDLMPSTEDFKLIEDAGNGNRLILHGNTYRAHSISHTKDRGLLVVFTSPGHPPMESLAKLAQSTYGLPRVTALAVWGTSFEGSGSGYNVFYYPGWEGHMFSSGKWEVDVTPIYGDQSQLTHHAHDYGRKFFKDFCYVMQELRRSGEETVLDFDNDWQIRGMQDMVDLCKGLFDRDTKEPFPWYKWPRHFFYAYKIPIKYGCPEEDADLNAKMAAAAESLTECDQIAYAQLAGFVLSGMKVCAAFRKTLRINIPFKDCLKENLKGS